MKTYRQSEDTQGFTQAEWEWLQEPEHQYGVQSIKVNENLKDVQSLDLNNITLENCYKVVKEKTNKVYGGSNE